jgi:hypothetical protein
VEIRENPQRVESVSLTEIQTGDLPNTSQMSPRENTYSIPSHSCCLCHCCCDSHETVLMSPRIRTETAERSQPPRQESCTACFLSPVCIVPFVIFLRGGGCLLLYLPDQTFCFPDNPIPGPKKRCKYRVRAEYMIVIPKRNLGRLQTAM